MWFEDTWKRPTRMRLAKTTQKLLTTEKMPQDRLLPMAAIKRMFFALNLAYNMGLKMIPPTFPMARPEARRPT
jgi:hypothetical protein